MVDLIEKQLQIKIGTFLLISIDLQRVYVSLFQFFSGNKNPNPIIGKGQSLQFESIRFVFGSLVRNDKIHLICMFAHWFLIVILDDKPKFNT